MPEWPKPLSMTMMLMMMMNNMYLREHEQPDEYADLARNRRHVQGARVNEWMGREGEEKACSSVAELAAVIFHILPAI